MPFDKKTVDSAVKAALAEGKGKRKFKQSVDVAVNFKDLDFKKAENRVNLDVVLPFATGGKKIAVFADGQGALEAKAIADLVISGADIPSYASDKVKQASLLDYILLATPALMPTVAKLLGQFLGTKGKMPKPILPNANLKQLAEQVKNSVSLKSKGKFLPVVHCAVGTEDMPEEQLAENVFTIVDAVRNKVSEPKIASVYVKTTMGKPAKIA